MNKTKNKSSGYLKICKIILNNKLSNNEKLDIIIEIIASLQGNEFPHNINLVLNDIFVILDNYLQENTGD